MVSGNQLRAVLCMVVVSCQTYALCETAGVIEVTRTQDLAAAMEKLRELPNDTPRRLILAGGRYLLDRPLVFSARDSGLSIESKDGERAELCGGARILNWKKVGDGPLWSAVLPVMHGKAWRFRMLVVGGRIARRARLPAEGFFHDTNPDFAPQAQAAPDAQLRSVPYQVEDIPRTLNAEGVEVRVYREWDESLSLIKAIDRSSHVLRLATPLRMPPGALGVHKYELLNVREGLTFSGQWYLDYARNAVYYWPNADEDMLTTEVWAPVLQTLMEIEGTAVMPARGISIKNLDFSITDAPPLSSGFAGADYPAAVLVKAANRVTLTGLRFRKLAGVGIKLMSSERVWIRGSSFLETGACAISSREVDEVEVSDCLIAGSGHMTPSANGMHLEGDRVHIEFTEVRDIPNTGISVYGVRCVVENNLVHRVMTEMADGAAYYTNGADGVVRNNWAYEVGVGERSKAPAYYIDDLAKNYLLEHNVASVDSWALHVHRAANNTVRDNIFIAQNTLKLSFQQSSGTIVEKNLFATQGDVIIRSPGGIGRMVTNTFSGAPGFKVFSRTDEDSVLHPFSIAGNTVAKVRFTNSKAMGFKFEASSAARESGISEPIALSSVGPRGVLP